MKKTIIGIIMVMMLSFNIAAAVESAELSTTLLSYSPVPAEPGSIITVNIKVLNDGDASASNAAIEFVDNYPFSVSEESEKLKSIGRLAEQEDYLAEYRVRIDGAAREGTNYLKVRYIIDQNSDNWFEKEIAVTVQAVQKTVSINKVEIVPEVLKPGEKANVQIKVKNLATSDLRDVGITLSLAQIVLGTTVVDLPFAPVGSSIEKRISYLRSGETADFDFVLQSYPTATGGIYKIPLSLEYTDDDGNDYSSIDLIGVAIRGEPDIMVQIDSSNLRSDNGKGDIIFSITNKGFDEIKFLTVKLTETDEFEVLSTSNEEYLGNVDSDDYETADFEVKMKGTGTSKVTFPVEISFKDALNEEYTIQKDLTLPLISTSDAGEEKSNTGTYIFIAIVVVIIGFVVYRKMRKKKAK